MRARHMSRFLTIVVCVLLGAGLLAPDAVTAHPDSSHASDAADPVPIQPAALSEPVDAGWATQIASAVFFTCALTTGGTIECWGRNDAGQLGDGTTRMRAAPVEVVGLSGAVRALSARGAHACVLAMSGEVSCWGYNADGELGDGTTTNRLTPVHVLDLPAGEGALSAGLDHTCVLTEHGGVKCWGNNSDGQLGDGTITSRLTAVDVVGLESGVRAVSAGDNSTCALTDAGGVKCWGSNYEGLLGDGTTTSRLTPVDVVGLTQGVQAVSVGRWHSCALTDAGGVKCWGYNGSGRLGDGTTISRLTPVDVTGLSAGVSAISVGDWHTCALTASGVKCWGWNGYGGLGDGTTTNRSVPVDVVGLTGEVSSLSAGAGHTCAVTSGIAKCWGYNYYGQIGDGTLVNRPTPVSVWNLAYDCPAVTEIPQAECAALIPLFKDTNGPLWQARTGWLQTTTPCSWYGVTCEAGHIARLDLGNNKLLGPLPAALGDLGALQRLDLSANSIDGPLPATLGNLTALQYLDLSRIGPAGETMPPGLGRLTALQILIWRNNNLSGAVPPELGNLAALRTLDLSDNNLSGPLPRELGSLAALQSLDLKNNRLSGPLPSELGDLTALQSLDLSNNALTGSLPPGLGNLIALQSLDLHTNDLSGEIPWGFGSLVALQTLNLHSNHLSGGIPSGLANLVTLQVLDLHDNRLTGGIPWELSGLTALQHLDLADNQLVWGISPMLGNLVNLRRLDLSFNQLSSAIPAELGRLTALTALSLNNNHLSGPIPPELGGLGTAVGRVAGQDAPPNTTDGVQAPPPGVYVDLSCNHLIGAIPGELGRIVGLQGLELSGNQLSGSIPAELINPAFYYRDLRYNLLKPPALYSDLTTQTVPPTGLRATAAGNAVTLTWAPIWYTADSGFYEVSYAGAPGGPFTVHGWTADKTAASYTLTGLAAGRTYFFRVRTFTPAHSYNAGSDVFNHAYIQQNNLWSDYTPVVSAGGAGTPTPTPSATPTPSVTAPPTPRQLWLPLVWR